jgi:hypothetical protein
VRHRDCLHVEAEGAAALRIVPRTIPNHGLPRLNELH